MIVILKKSAERQQVELFNTWLHNMGLETHMSVGENHTIVGLVGDTSRVDMESILALDIILILVLQKENSVFGHALVKGM